MIFLKGYVLKLLTNNLVKNTYSLHFLFIMVKFKNKLTNDKYLRLELVFF
jgi:hypothetical protein